MHPLVFEGAVSVHHGRCRVAGLRPLRESVAPTGLAGRGDFHPALTRWANDCRRLAACLSRLRACSCRLAELVAVARPAVGCGWQSWDRGWARPSQRYWRGLVW